MGKETNIDCMKYRKSTHLSGIDVETMISEKKDCILTIKQVFYDTNVEVSGNKTSGYFCEFKENVKPMVLNSGNRKIITKIVKYTKNLSDVESRNIGNWSDIQLELYFDSTVKMMGAITGGIKVYEKYPLPILLSDSKQFDNCKIAIEKNGYTIEQIRQKYQVSNEVEQLLISK